MFYHFKDKHRLSEVKLEFKGQNCMFNSYEMELYSAERVWSVTSRLGTGKWLTLFYSVWTRAKTKSHIGQCEKGSN
jgi:hypothetical protein